MEEERDGIGELLARAFTDRGEDEVAGGRAAAVRAGNRIETARRRSRARTARGSRLRLAILGLGWLAAAAWVVRSALSLSAGQRPSLAPVCAAEGAEAVAALLAVTPVQLLTGLLLLAAATVAAVRLAVADD